MREPANAANIRRAVGAYFAGAGLDPASSSEIVAGELAMVEDERGAIAALERLATLIDGAVKATRRTKTGPAIGWALSFPDRAVAPTVVYRNGSGFFVGWP